MLNWIEKYKPHKISDFENSNYTKLYYDFKNIKNMLIYGLPGTGKTTYINLIINNYLKDKHNDDDLLNLNASDERGINTVRNKIKIFCKKKNNKNNFKLVILDESDSLTIDAQMSMRKIIEDYNNTKFIFICNYKNKIINPLISRCVVIYFNKYSNKYIQSKCLYILKNENILNNTNYDMYLSYINKFINIFNSDIRKVINNLEYIVLLKLNKYDEYIINNLFGTLTINLLNKILLNVTSIKNINDTIKLLSYYNINNIIENFNDIIITHEKLTYNNKKKLLNLLSFIDSIKKKNIDYEIILYKLLKDYIKYSK